VVRGALDSVSHGITNGHEPPEELSEGKRPFTWVAAWHIRPVESIDSIFKALPPDEPHGIKGSSVGKSPQPVHGRVDASV
jgi:hypothetical protein